MTAPWHEQTAGAIRAAIADKEVTAREVAEHFLGRIGEVDGRVGAYTQVWTAAAMAQAAEVDRAVAEDAPLGPLAGVPISLKELLCTTDGETTCSSRILAGYRSPYDATAVRKLRDAGAVFLGKVNMDEFAMGSSTENSAVQATRNPWDLERVPGGSSGGSAASVAADCCALSIGSDTGGSIRQPAALCGCVGLKPTYGRVSRYGLVAFASSLDQIGPLTKDVRDAALTLGVLAGRDPMDATTVDKPASGFEEALTGDVKGLRIGLPKEYFPDSLNGEMKALVMAAAKRLEDAGAELVEVSLPHTEYAVAVYYIIAPAEASANLARFDGVRYGFRHPDAKDVNDLYVLTKSEGFGPEVQRRIMLGTYALSAGYYDAYYKKAQQVRALVTRDFEAAFGKCDVLLTPTSPSAAFPLGAKTDDPLEMYLNDIFTISANLAALPGISVPCGLTEQGLPAGVQFIGRAFDEATMLRAAHGYEQLRGALAAKPAL